MFIVTVILSVAAVLWAYASMLMHVNKACVATHPDTMSSNPNPNLTLNDRF